MSRDARTYVAGLQTRHDFKRHHELTRALTRPQAANVHISKHCRGINVIADKTLPPQWRVLSWQKRSILMELRRLADLPRPGHIEFAGDPAQFLVRECDMFDKRDRVSGVRSVRELIAQGFIVLDGNTARLQYVPTPCVPGTHIERTSDVRRTHVEPTTRPKPLKSHLGTEGALLLRVKKREELREEIKSESESESARAHTRGLIPIVQDPGPMKPPRFPPLPEPDERPEPASRVWSLHHAVLGLANGSLGVPGKAYGACQAVAAAAAAESGADCGEAFEAAVRRILVAWGQDDWVRKHKPSLNNLATTLHKYARPTEAPTLAREPSWFHVCPITMTEAEWRTKHAEYAQQHGTKNALAI